MEDIKNLNLSYEIYNKGIEASIERLYMDLYALNDDRDLSIKSMEPIPILYTIITQERILDTGITNMEDVKLVLKFCINSLEEFLSIRNYEKCYPNKGNPEWDKIEELYRELNK